MNVTVPLNRSQATASGTTPYTIGSGYYAYKSLTNIHLVGRRWLLSERRWVKSVGWFISLPTREEYTIDSASGSLDLSPPGESLLNDAHQNLQVYRGPLRLSWKRKIFGIFPNGAGSSVAPNVKVEPRYRTGGASPSLLPCFNAAEPEDTYTDPTRALICIDVANFSVASSGRTCPVILTGKSNSPFHAGQQDPATYVVRSATISVDPVCLFG